MSTAPTAIGEKVSVKGHIRSHEDLIIEGDVEGTIEIPGHQLTVAASGNLRAEINARDVDVRGTFEGQVEAVDKVFIRAGAKFTGEVHSAGIVIEDGGSFQGSVDLSRQPAPKRPEQARPAQQVLAS